MMNEEKTKGCLRLLIAALHIFCTAPMWMGLAGGILYYIGAPTALWVMFWMLVPLTLVEITVVAVLHAISDD